MVLQIQGRSRSALSCGVGIGPSSWATQPSLRIRPLRGPSHSVRRLGRVVPSAVSPLPSLDEDADSDRLRQERLASSELRPRPGTGFESGHVSLAIYLGSASIVAVLATLIHPTLLQAIALTFGIRPTADDFETSFFGLLSIVYSVLSGQTFLFLYERQINIVQELYNEVFALELLVQQCFLVCKEPGLRVEMARTIRYYMNEEIYNPTDMASPFSDTSPYMDILRLLLLMQDEGVLVTDLVDVTKQLADAQSRRSAMAAQILPWLHWVVMHGMELIFVITFLMFDASQVDMNLPEAYEKVPVATRLFFGALCGLLFLTTQILKDLDQPVSGLYGFRPALDGRLALVEKLLTELETKTEGKNPNSVEILRRLGLIGAHVKPTPLGPPHTDAGLQVPNVGPRRRRGRSASGKMKWGGKAKRWGG